MNSKSPLDSALKCFVFFLISQPLVYLLQVPFSAVGWQIFGYYKYWFIWTILTLPMGFIGYYMKQNKWWGLLILTPMLLLLGFHFAMYLRKTFYYFPYHLLSAIFCFVTLLLYPLVIFNDKKIKTAGVIISALIVVAGIIYSFVNPLVYDTVPLVNGGSDGAVFDDTYKVYLEDKRFGDVAIEYDEGLQDYLIRAGFRKGGKTNLILEDPSGKKSIYEIDIRYHNFDISKK